ncbi:hypothetical protein AVEN_107834-1, partial [Araneus ventricosus]
VGSINVAKRTDNTLRKEYMDEELGKLRNGDMSFEESIFNFKIEETEEVNNSDNNIPFARKAAASSDCINNIVYNQLTN